MTQEKTYNGLLETHCRNGRPACPVPGFGFCSVLEYSLHPSGLFFVDSTVVVVCGCKWWQYVLGRCCRGQNLRILWDKRP